MTHFAIIAIIGVFCIVSVAVYTVVNIKSLFRDYKRDMAEIYSEYERIKKKEEDMFYENKKLKEEIEELKKRYKDA